jgi:cytoskeletal protein CcmA (bactofilin family)
MFSKDTKSSSESLSAPRSSGAAKSISGTPSIISADLRITGNLHSNGDIQIDGRIDGNVDSKSLTIGDDAEVNGIISCERVRVCGKVSGEIRAAWIVLAKSARVSADLVHKSLEIESGASMEGSVSRLEGDPRSAQETETDTPHKAEATKVAKIADVQSGATASASGNGSAAAI